jgi:hypothetical protein
MHLKVSIHAVLLFYMHLNAPVHAFHGVRSLKDCLGGGARLGPCVLIRGIRVFADSQSDHDQFTECIERSNQAPRNRRRWLPFVRRALRWQADIEGESMQRANDKKIDVSK